MEAEQASFFLYFIWKSKITIAIFTANLWSYFKHVHSHYWHNSQHCWQKWAKSRVESAEQTAHFLWIWESEIDRVPFFWLLVCSDYVKFYFVSAHPPQIIEIFNTDSALTPQNCDSIVTYRHVAWKNTSPLCLHQQRTFLDSASAKNVLSPRPQSPKSAFCPTLLRSSFIGGGGVKIFSAFPTCHHGQTSDAFFCDCVWLVVIIYFQDSGMCSGLL